MFSKPDISQYAHSATQGSQPTITIDTNLGALEWTRTAGPTRALVSTRKELFDHDFINKSFGGDEMPWARSMTEAEIHKMLDNSLTFGLSTEAQAEPGAETTLAWTQVGIARLITAHVTFAYLTDVYIAPEVRRYGHARWLMGCVREVMASMPAIRRGMLVTGLAYGAQFYKETLGCYNIDEEKDE